MWRLFKSVFLFSTLLTRTECRHDPVGQPHVQLGDTNLIGKHLQPSNLEFLGGKDSPSHRVPAFFKLWYSSLHCGHSMLAITVTHAYSPQTHSPSHRSNHLRICQRTVSPSISSGLPLLTLTPRCLSWSGFMEGDSHVRGECLYLLVNSRRFTDGDSFFYDGTFLVGQSVNRVRTPSHTHKSFTLLLIDATHRGHRSCTCLSTIVLALSASLKDPRR